MRIYPAIRARMGDWNYYIVRMKMREVASEVNIAHDFYEDNTLSDAIQRELNTSRVKKEIVGYLARRSDRFFSSIVVAAMDGEPIWHPVEMDTNVVPEIFSHSKTLRDSFGVLSFGEEPKYYALDGQHRVAAIKLLVRREVDVDAPEGFDDDLLSVIVVLREEHEVSADEWLQRYRRLFSSLNRYARPTDRDTNIIMDEDDLFSILTRRVITDHDFFKAPGRERDSYRVQTHGKNLRKGVNHFTTLQTLYGMNETLLRTRSRGARGWYSDGESLDAQVRPEEKFIEDTYEELAKYWNAILATIPILREEPKNRREHDPDRHDDHIGDHLLFWTIGQELFAKIVRNLLDAKFPTASHASHAEMVAALQPLTNIPWDLHGQPWRHLLLVKVPETNKWRMRSEERKAALEIAERLLRWLVNLDPLDEDGIAELRGEWRAHLYLDATPDETPDQMWAEIVAIRGGILAGN